MVLVAEAFGILSRSYGVYIFFVGLSVQIILFIYLMTRLLMKKGELKRGVRIIRHKIEDKHIKGGTDILPSFIGATNPRKASIFKIFVEVIDFKNPPEFGVCKMGKGNMKVTDIKKHLLGVKVGVVQGSFIFDADIIVRPDEKINFKFKDDVNIKLFFVGELYIP